MKTAIKLVSLVILTTVLNNFQPAVAQEKKPSKETIVKNLINNQQYVFHAQYAIPLAGAQRYLTTDYTVNVVKDTVQCDLPYFGRAYTAPISPSDNGLQFVSTNFDYKITERKKGGWDVTIKTKDAQEVHTLNLTIFTNGTASLNVNSTNRQPISFSGYVSEKKLKK